MVVTFAVLTFLREHLFLLTVSESFTLSRQGRRNSRSVRGSRKPEAVHIADTREQEPGTTVTFKDLPLVTYFCQLGPIS